MRKTQLSLLSIFPPSVILCDANNLVEETENLSYIVLITLWPDRQYTNLINKSSSYNRNDPSPFLPLFSSLMLLTGTKYQLRTYAVDFKMHTNTVNYKERW